MHYAYRSLLFICSIILLLCCSKHAIDGAPLFHRSTVLLTPVVDIAPTKKISQRRFIEHIFQSTLPHTGYVTMPKSLIPYWQFSDYFSSLADISDILIYGQGGNHKVRRFGGGTLEASWAINYNILAGPTLAFDLPMAFRASSQQTFVDRITAQCRALRAYNPRIKITLAGVCIGTIGILEYATAQKSGHAIKALVLESPMLSIKQMAYQAAQSYVPWFPKGGFIVHNIFKAWFPGCDKHEKNILEKIKKMPPDIPVLIAHVKGDSLLSDADMMRLIRAFQQKNSQNIYLLVYDHPTIRHGRLKQTAAFQNVVHAFLQKYDAPHNATLAQQGSNLLKTALQNGQATSIDQWSVVTAVSV